MGISWLDDFLTKTPTWKIVLGCLLIALVLGTDISIKRTVAYSHGHMFETERSQHSKVELKLFEIPSLAECQNPKANQFYEDMQKEYLVDNGFVTVHSMWLGLCIQIRRGTISQFQGNLVFDNILTMFDASRFISEPFDSSTKEQS